MKLIKPKPLKPGDTLGIVACSTPITASSEETIERTYQRLRAYGFKLVEAPNCRKTYGHAAGITYGKPVVPDFTWKHFGKVVMTPEIPFRLTASREYSDNPWYMEPEKQMRFESNPGWKIYRKGKAEGAIIGGNLGTMLLLAGTKYWPNLRGKILFVEDDEAESSKTMDRLFTQLRQMGAYDLITGMVVGRFHRNVKFNESDSMEMILDESLNGYKFPVITGVDFGHTDPLITFPIGIKCRMDTKKPEIVFLERAVKA